MSTNTSAIAALGDDIISRGKPSFEDALSSFVEGCVRISQVHQIRNYPKCQAPTFSVMLGKKFARIVRTDTSGDPKSIWSGEQKSVHCFVNMETGDVLKAAGWKAPAKGARGNIFDANNGLGRMNEYGPEYNK